MVYREGPVRCNHCYGCYRNARAQDFKRLVAGVDQVMKDVPAQLVELWLEKHARLLTLTELPLDWGGNYSVAMHAARTAETIETLRDRYRKRWKVGDVEFRYFGQREPQGADAGYRLHLHVLVFAEDLPTWEGMRTDERNIGFQAWCDEMEMLRAQGDAGGKQALELLSWGWGASDCRPVRSRWDLWEYLTKELTSMLDEEPTPELMDRMFTDRGIGRRVRRSFYSRPWYGLEESEVWYRRAPVWERAEPAIGEPAEAGREDLFVDPETGEVVVNPLAAFGWSMVRAVTNATIARDLREAGVDVRPLRRRWYDLDKARVMLNQRRRKELLRRNLSDDEIAEGGWEVLGLSGMRWIVDELSRRFAREKVVLERKSGLRIPWSWPMLWKVERWGDERSESPAAADGRPWSGAESSGAGALQISSRGCSTRSTTRLRSLGIQGRSLGCG